MSNTPGVLTDATADLTLTLMLMLCRRAGEGERELRAGAWSGWRPTHLVGRQMTGKTLGIIGMGRIGRAVAHRAHFGFGMDVVFQNRSPVADGGGVGGRQLASVAEVCAASDFVSLHCAATPETRHILRRDALAAMSPSAYVINTARGDVVDEDALVAALESGAIGGAGLDVFQGEPKVNPAIMAVPNTVLLPHLGSATEETRVAMGMKVVENARALPWARCCRTRSDDGRIRLEGARRPRIRCCAGCRAPGRGDRRGHEGSECGPDCRDCRRQGRRLRWPWPSETAAAMRRASLSPRMKAMPTFPA
ncbi:MAG: hypothetical protein CM15mP115_22680 [Alphaproteobacteria bacterium]|nr:MAG: hypothetical protein CM15mP115_22680 [Alphaproteobacteria bacterium]